MKMDGCNAVGYSGKKQVQLFCISCLLANFLLNFLESDNL